MTVRQQSGGTRENQVARMPIDRPAVRDAAHREPRSTSASVAKNLSEVILEQLAAHEPVTSPLLFFAIRSVEATLPPSAQRRVDLPLAAAIDAAYAGEVAEFAATFFELDPERRQEAWMTLRRRTSDSPALTARLEELACGLEIDCGAMAAERPAVQRLATLVREFFVLPPLERAARRREWFASHKAEAKALRSAGWHLAWRFPETARLDPVFLQTLRSPNRPKRWWSEIKISVQTRRLNRVDTFVDTHPKSCVLAAVLIMGTIIFVAITSDESGPRNRSSSSRFGTQAPEVIYRVRPHKASATAKSKKASPTVRPVPKQLTPKIQGSGV